MKAPKQRICPGQLGKYQNGVVERTIKEIGRMARAMMYTAEVPDLASAYCVLQAVDILNMLPSILQIQPPTLRDSRRISYIITLLLHWSNFMRLGDSALCILTLIILTPCAQIFVRPPAFICAALTIVTVRVTLSGSTVIMARDANSSSLNYRVIFGIISHAIGLRQAPLSFSDICCS
jgi:hypothetical protein